MHTPPNILTIAGSDSGGGAGIQADLKTIFALGGFGVCAITALTAQNGAGVKGIEPTSPEFVKLQMETVLQGFEVKAAKTGMLFSAAIVSAVAETLAKRTFPLVVDPVCISQSGCRLLEIDAIQALRDLLIPCCDLLTPNLPEAEELCGLKIKNSDDIYEAGKRLLALGAKAVLIKGGHFESGIINRDWLVTPDMPAREFIQPHVETNNNHGTGCTLSAAIACNLGKGLPLETAIAKAQEYLNLALRKSYAPGMGFGPVNHAAALATPF